MSTATPDTPAIARKLQAAGFSDVQAEAVTDALRGVRDTDLSMLATKADLIAAKGDLRTEIAETKHEILQSVLSANGFQTIVIVGAVVALARGLH